jgi:hypothetical protein
MVTVSEHGDRKGSPLLYAHERRTCIVGATLAVALGLYAHGRQTCIVGATLAVALA